MIRRASSGAWRFRAAAAAIFAVVTIALIVLWRQAEAPSVGLPDTSIRPMLAPVTTEIASRSRSKDSVFNAIGPAPPETKPVHSILVYVHGISCHSPDYSAPFQFRLANALGMTREPDPNGGPPPVTIVELTPGGKTSNTVADYLSTDDFDVWSADASPAEVKSRYQSMLRTKTIPKAFQRACSDPDGGTLVPPLDHPRLSIRHFANTGGDRLSVVEVLWSPVSERQKLTKVGEDLNLDASPLRTKPLWPRDKPAPRADVEQRALANQLLKASVINGAIADAIFYLGDGGPSIRAAVMAGIVQAMSLRKQSETAKSHAVRMIMVTESLGSRIAFDTMREAPDRFAGELEDTLALLKSKPRVVMFANQLPLLDIAKRPDRSLADSRNFTADVKRQAARAAALVQAADEDAGGKHYQFHSPQDPPSWRACADAFQYYADAATLFSQSHFGARISGDSASALADNMEIVLTRPVTPVLALFDGPGAETSLTVNLKAATKIAGNAMAFLAFSPGGLGYANCQRKVAQERANVDAYYARRDATAPVRDAAARSERLLKIAEDVRHAKIADIDAISNSRASMVFGLMYVELNYLSQFCAKPDADARVCNPGAVKARLRRVAALVPRIEVLAFSDPNDLLSYRVTAEQYESETFDFINVPIRLADPILPAGGRWGGFTPPMEAHTNHKFDNRILAMLVCGWDATGGRTFAAVNGKPCPLQLGSD